LVSPPCAQKNAQPKQEVSIFDEALSARRAEGTKIIWQINVSIAANIIVKG
jgi:hypothetical protein